MTRVFLSHSSHDGNLAVAIAASLKRCVDEGVFCYEDTTTTSFPETMSEEIEKCTHMVVLVGDEESKHQNTEVSSFYARKKGDKSHFFFVDCRTRRETFLPSIFALYEDNIRFRCEEDSPATSGLKAAHEIAKTFQWDWQASDGLPANPHLFDYEKHIIDFYTKLLTTEREPETGTHEKLLDGAPPEWPTVHELRFPDGNTRDNPDTLQKQVGEWRDPDARVLVAALSQYHKAGEPDCHQLGCQLRNGLCFPEAGPREKHIFPNRTNNLTVGILVSGGIAPGINAVIDGITQRHFLYARENEYTVHVHGFLNGFHAFYHLSGAYVDLIPDDKTRVPNAIITADFADAGGSMLGTSRVDNLIDPATRIEALEKIVAQAYSWPLDILYVIGGDGSMKAAHAIWSHADDYAKRNGINKPLSVVGIPKTMDNDILWVWQSFGFLSAVERAREVIQHLHTEVNSNPRLCVVQLFGSDSGFVVSHAVLASRTGTCDAALIPEVPFTMRKLAEFIKRQMAARTPRRSRRIPAALVVMAETAIPVDAMDFIDDPDVALIDKEKDAIRKFDRLRTTKCRIQGQTDEWLRSGGLKIVSRGLEKLIKSDEITVNGSFEMPEWSLLRIFTNEPRHLLRAIPPSCMDIISGQRLGTLAVDNALAGYTDFMISQWLTEYVLVPLSLVVLGRKRIPQKGVFWRSVRSKTGQHSLVGQLESEEE